MTCKCGCHDDKPRTTGLRRYVPMVIGLVVLAVLITVAAFGKKDAAKQANPLSHSAAATPGR